MHRALQKPMRCFRAQIPQVQFLPSDPFSLPVPRYGFVEFDDLRDADDAVYELNGKDLCGERVIVEHARGPRRDSSYGSGRSKHLCICIHGLF